jgi:hypothetical protein
MGKQPKLPAVKIPWGKYWQRVFIRAKTDGSAWWRDQIVIALILALLPLVIQFVWGLLKPGQLWTNAMPITLSYSALLVIFVIVHVARAPWKLYNEEVDKQIALEGSIETLEKDLAVERENLEGAPKVKVFSLSPPDGKVWLHNTGMEALGVHLIPVESENYTLSSETLELAQGGQAWLDLVADHKAGDARDASRVLERLAALQIYFDDCRPTLDPTVEHPLVYTMRNSLVSTVFHIRYFDLSRQKEYRSIFRLTWSNLFKRIETIELLCIRRVMPPTEPSGSLKTQPLGLSTHAD